MPELNPSQIQQGWGQILKQVKALHALAGGYLGWITQDKGYVQRWFIETVVIEVTVMIVKRLAVIRR